MQCRWKSKWRCQNLVLRRNARKAIINPAVALEVKVRCLTPKKILDLDLTVFQWAELVKMCFPTHFVKAPYTLQKVEEKVW